MSRQARWQLIGRASLPDAPPSLATLGIKERLLHRWAEVHAEDDERAAGPGTSKAGKPDASEEAAAEGLPSSSGREGGGGNAAAAAAGGFASPTQRAFFASLNSYADVVVAGRPYPGGAGASSGTTVPPRRGRAAGGGLEDPDEHMDAYLLHVLNHVAKTADRIKKNNDRCVGAGGEPFPLCAGVSQWGWGWGKEEGGRSWTGLRSPLIFASLIELGTLCNTLFLASGVRLEAATTAAIAASKAGKAAAGGGGAGAVEAGAVGKKAGGKTHGKPVAGGALSKSALAAAAGEALPRDQVSSAVGEGGGDDAYEGGGEGLPILSS